MPSKKQKQDVATHPYYLWLVEPKSKKPVKQQTLDTGDGTLEVIADLAEDGTVIGLEFPVVPESWLEIDGDPVMVGDTVEVNE